MRSPEMQNVEHATLDQRTANIRPDLGKPESADRENSVESSKLHPDQNASEPADAGAARELLHPVEAPPPTPYAQTKEERVQAIIDFNSRIVGISDSEFGDWMRRANMYWWHLAEALHGEKSPVIRQCLQEIHRVIQYNPDFSILPTQRKVISLSQKIERVLGGHSEMTDYPVSLSSSGEQQAPDYSMMIENRKDADVAPVTSDGSNKGFIGKG